MLTVRNEFYWIDGPWPGRLAILPRPRGGEWLEDEVRAWRHANIDIVVSLLTVEEVEDFDLAKEAALCRIHGIEHISFPIPDRRIPTSQAAALELLQVLKTRLTEGKNVAVHCRQGIGRSAVIAAGELVFSGTESETALQRVTEARGFSVPETAEQREWVMGLADVVPAKPYRPKGAA